MSSENDNDPPYPKTTKLMTSLTQQMEKMQRHIEKRMGERFDDMKRSTQELIGRHGEEETLITTVKSIQNK